MMIGAARRRGLLALSVSCALALLPLVARAAPPPVPVPAVARPQRIVSVGGAVTEIVFALGAGGSVVATDSSSRFPAEAEKLPKIGYVRSVSVEGIIAQNPTLVLLHEGAGPPAAVEQLKRSGLPVHVVPEAGSVEDARGRIRHVAKFLGRAAEGEAVIKRLDADINQATVLAKIIKTPPRVLFLYARGPGAVSVGGKDSSAAIMIALAGGKNAVDDFTGFQPLTAEAAVGAAPDVLLLPQHGFDSVGGREGLLKLPGLGATPAVKNNRIVSVDDGPLLGYGPRMGQALLALARSFADPKR